MKYKVLRFFTILFSVFFLVGTIIYAGSSEVEEVASNKNVYAVAGIVCLVLFVLCIILSIKLKEKIKQPIEQAKQKALNDRNAQFTTNIKHFNGLPIAEGVMTNCYWCNDKILFEANGASFNLPLYKLTDVSIKTDVEIQKQYVSSMGGAIAGAALFGTLGAMIGGRAKEKTSRQITEYLIFTYCDNEELKYIAFDCTLFPKAKQFVEAFQKIKPATTQSFDL